MFGREGPMVKGFKGNTYAPSDKYRHFRQEKIDKKRHTKNKNCHIGVTLDRKWLSSKI